MIQNATPIAVTMPAERWQQVLAILQEALAPHRVTDPLIRDIHQQCMREERPEGQRDYNVTQLREMEGGAAE